MLDVIADPGDGRVPEVAGTCLAALGAQLRSIKEQVLKFGRLIMAWHRQSEIVARRQGGTGWADPRREAYPPPAEDRR